MDFASKTIHEQAMLLTILSLVFTLVALFPFKAQVGARLMAISALGFALCVLLSAVGWQTHYVWIGVIAGGFEILGLIAILVKLKQTWSTRPLP